MIILYSDSWCALSHWIRMILHEKSVEFKLLDIAIAKNVDIAQLSPNGELPVLSDDIDKSSKKRNMVLYDIRVMSEYIDDRFPYPQLLPSDPAEKARMRMILSRFDKDVMQHVRVLDRFSQSDSRPKKSVDLAKSVIIKLIDSLISVFNSRLIFFNSNHFSLLDTAITPILWRLLHYDIEIKKQWKSIMKYADNQFQRNSFQLSLSAVEKTMQDVSKSTLTK